LPLLAEGGNILRISPNDLRISPSNQPHFRPLLGANIPVARSMEVYGGHHALIIIYEWTTFCRLKFEVRDTGTVTTMLDKLGWTSLKKKQRNNSLFIIHAILSISNQLTPPDGMEGIEPTAF